MSAMFHVQIHHLVCPDGGGRRSTLRPLGMGALFGVQVTLYIYISAAWDKVPTEFGNI